MKGIEVTPLDLAQRFIGVGEVAGSASNAQVLAMLRLDEKWPEGDHVPWCSAFMNYVAWLLRLPRSKSLQARSGLAAGRPVNLEDAAAGFDVVLSQRGDGPQSGPDVINAPGARGTVRWSRGRGRFFFSVAISPTRSTYHVSPKANCLVFAD